MKKNLVLLKTWASLDISSIRRPITYITDILCWKFKSWWLNVGQVHSAHFEIQGPRRMEISVLLRKSWVDTKGQSGHYWPGFLNLMLSLPSWVEIRRSVSSQPNIRVGSPRLFTTAQMLMAIPGAEYSTQYTTMTSTVFRCASTPCTDHLVHCCTPFLWRL